MVSQVLFLLIVLRAIRTFLPGILVGVRLTILLMLLEILELLDLLATMLTGLILILSKMRFLMLCEPGFDQESLVACRAHKCRSRDIMLPHVKVEGGLVTKIPVTGGAVIRGLFHVLGPQVSFESAGITEFQFADRALLVIPFYSLHHVTDLLCLVLSAWVVHGKGLLQI